MFVIVNVINFVKRYPALVRDTLLVLLVILLTTMVEHRRHPVQPAPAPVAKVSTLPALPPNTVTVDVPVITTKTVTKLVTDPAQAALVKMLLAENAQLKTEVNGVTIASAQSESHGGGAITPTAAAPGLPDSAAVGSVHFKDYRLDFTATGEHADYTLTQKFLLTSTTGRRADGTPLNLAKLYEQTPDGPREIPITESKGLVVDQTAQHWMTGIAVQAGLAASAAPAGSGAVRNGVVLLQWLSRGRTRAAEDQRFTLLEPAFMVGSGVREFGLVPFAVNLGQLRHQPLTNLWVGPYVSSSRVGGVLTVKF